MPEQKYTPDGVAVISNATYESTVEILARDAKKIHLKKT